MKVTVAPDAPLGVREFRIATPHHGISTIGLLAIGDEPELIETEPNNDAEHAQALTVPCIMNGRFQQAEDVDWYKFNAAAGQEIVFAVNCARLEDKIHDISPHADPMLVLLRHFWKRTGSQRRLLSRRFPDALQVCEGRRVPNTDSRRKLPGQPTLGLSP